MNLFKVAFNKKIITTHMINVHDSTRRSIIDVKLVFLYIRKMRINPSNFINLHSSFEPVTSQTKDIFFCH
jgi:hypothetical protein